MSTKTNVDDLIKVLRNEMLKEWREWDGDNRLVRIVQAPTHAVNNAPALETVIAYDGTSSRIQKKRELEIQWNSAWDI